MVRLRNPTGRNTKAYVLEINGRSFYFSYETCIAFCGVTFAKEGYVSVRRENTWGPTTGRHMNEMHVRHFDVVGEDEFDDIVNMAFGSPKITWIAEIVAAASPADGKRSEWMAGCDSTREYVARRVADLICTTDQERREFFRKADVLEL